MVHLLNANKQCIAEICKRHFVKSLYVFGSSVKGNFTDDSDIDFLYEIDIESFPGWSTGKYDYADNLLSLENALNQLLKRAIDLIPYSEILNKYFKQSVEKSKQMIYAA